jgi:hypothetical protein
MRKLYGTIRELKEWPGRGRPGREEGTREILFPPTPYVAGLPHQRADHRSHADLSRCTGPALTEQAGLTGGLHFQFWLPNFSKPCCQKGANKPLDVLGECSIRLKRSFEDISLQNLILNWRTL